MAFKTLTLLLSIISLGQCLVPLSNTALQHIDPNAFKASKLNLILPKVGQEITIPASESTLGKLIKIQVPALDLIASGTDFDARATSVLQKSVPKALTDFGGNVQLADKGVSLVKKIVLGMLSQDAGLMKRELALERRGFFGDAWDWIKDVGIEIGCNVFAAAAVPMYLLAAGDYAIENGSGQKLNDDLLWHMWPIHGPIATEATVYYTATRPPFFGGALGTTINRDVYTPLNGPPTFAWQDFAPLEKDWTQLVELLLHELQHVKQYKDSGYVLPVFAHKYLFNFCKAGGYSANPLEQEGVAAGSKMDTELSRFSDGHRFWMTWRTFNLVKSVGYPIEVHYHEPYDVHGLPIIEKNHERGVIQIKRKQYTSDAQCYRTFTNEEVAQRPQGACTGYTDGICFTKRSEDEQHSAPLSLAARASAWLRREKRSPSPLPPIKGTDIDGNPYGKKTPCTPDEKAAKKAACEAMMRPWNNLNARAWYCAADVP